MVDQGTANGRSSEIVIRVPASGKQPECQLLRVFASLSATFEAHGAPLADALNRLNVVLEAERSRFDSTVMAAVSSLRASMEAAPVPGVQVEVIE